MKTMWRTIKIAIAIEINEKLMKQIGMCVSFFKLSAEVCEHYEMLIRLRSFVPFSRFRLNAVFFVIVFFLVSTNRTPSRTVKVSEENMAEVQKEYSIGSKASSFIF